MATNFKRHFKIRTPSLKLCSKRTRHGDESMFKNRTCCRLNCNERKWISSVKWRPDTERLVLFVVALSVLNSCHAYQEQKFAMEPQDQSAILGSRVTLPCRVEYKAGTLQWTKDDFGLGSHRNLSGYDRYKMIGSDEEGDYSLDISNVTLEDDADYQCQVSSGLKGEPGIRSRYAHLTVLVAPDPPRIIQGAFIDATEGRNLSIECVSSGGKPASEITWLDGEQGVITAGVESRIDIHADGQRFITRSVLRLTPTQDHHNHTYTCQAQNTADRAHRMAMVHVEVKYAPKVKIFFKSNDNQEVIPEGTEARIGCKVDANPAPKLYNWYINNKAVIGDYEQELIIFNVSRMLNEAAVKCEVSNTVGIGFDTTTLDVTYPPVFKTRPKSIEAEDGDSVTLECDVDSNPAPKIKWLLHEPGRIGVKGKKANLDITVTSETAGRYLCKASVDGYPEIEAEANILIKGVPTIVSNKTQFGGEGDRVTIECAAVSVPKPDDISWYYEGRQISVIRDPDYAIVEQILSGGITKSSLVIRSSRSKHFGVYNCSVTNEYGNANAGILLKAYKTLPLLLILAGVTAGIVVFSAFTILLVCCHRNRRKNDDTVNEKPDVTATSGDLYKDSDRSSNISDLKIQIPRGDGNYDLDYTSSDHTGSSLKLAGLPLAGPVSLPLRHGDPMMHFRYSNDYSDPAYTEAYLKAPGYLSYAEYTPDYPPPPGLRVQSPNPMEISSGNRSMQGSLTRSIDTASTLPLSAENISQNNSIQRSENKQQSETESINNLGLPISNEATSTPIYALPNTRGLNQNGNVLPSGLDVRYAATYGNPYLRNTSSAFGGHVHASKPSAAAAPPPYSARNSTVLPAGYGNQTPSATNV